MRGAYFVFGHPIDRKALTQTVGKHKSKAEHVVQWRELEGEGVLAAESCNQFLLMTGSCVTHPSSLLCLL